MIRTILAGSVLAAALCRSTGEGRLAVRTATMRLGQLSCGRSARLCRYLGSGGRSQLFLEARTLEVGLPISSS